MAASTRTTSAVLALADIPAPEHVRTVPLRVGAMTRYCIHVQSAVLGHVTYWAERDDTGRAWVLLPDGIRPYVQPVAEGLPLLRDAVAAALANVRLSDLTAVRVHGVTYAALGLPEPEPCGDPDPSAPGDPERGCTVRKGHDGYHANRGNAWPPVAQFGAVDALFAFTSGAAIGTPERPASVGGVPFVGRGQHYPDGRCTGYAPGAGNVSRCACGHGRGSDCHR